MTPYYDKGGITLYCGDCREVLPTLGKVDLVLTDPPYGIGVGVKVSRYENEAMYGASVAPKRNYGEADWDSEPADQSLIELAIGKATYSIVWGGNYWQLPATSCVLVWDKMAHGNDFADAELAWTNLNKAVRVKQYLWSGCMKQRQEYRWHRTQKPLAVIQWAIQQAPDDCKTILDPFAGSGTTGVAAKLLGRKAILIEIEKKYCDIAVERLRQGVLDFPLDNSD